MLLSRIIIFDSVVKQTLTWHCLVIIRHLFIWHFNASDCRSQWPRGLRRRSAAARLLRLWVRIPPGGMDVCCECCVLSGRGLCDELITRSEESYRLWCVVVCDLETSSMRRPWPALGCSATENKQNSHIWFTNVMSTVTFIGSCTLWKGGVWSASE